jgi:hypothetical protein
MTPRTFWAILIKLLGVYTIIESITSIPIYLGNIYSLSISYTSSYREVENPTVFYVQAVYMLLVIIIYGVVLYYCIFKTDSIINRLKLDEGYKDERFEFNIHRSTILKIVIMVTGGLLLTESIPRLLSDILEYTQMVKNYNKITDVPETKYILFTSAQIFIGYFMLTCSRMIVNFIERKRREPVVESSKE